MNNVKLIHRLNLSFGILLLCVLTITAVLIYPLLLHTFIDRQRQEMQIQGNILINFAVPPTPAMPAHSQELPEQKHSAFEGGQIYMVLFSPDDQVIYSNLPPAETKQWIELSKQLDNRIWRVQNDQYIVETISRKGSMPLANDITAIMATPIKEIKTLQLSLFLRMLIILFVGVMTAFLLSTLITKRLVTPLANLRKELKKVETRRFSEVQLVASGGEIGEVAKSVYQLASVLEKY